MTNIEQYKNDIAYNANNILFTMTDDEAMGQRGQGVYVQDFYDNGNECTNFIFDNGNKYVFDKVEQMLYVCEPIPKEYFIHKHIEKTISDFMTEFQINKLDKEIFIYCSDNEINAGSLIRLLPYREENIVYITNIMIPNELKHRGLGKLLIKQIFEICERLNYRLVLLNVVESFSQSLKKRNAIFLDFETVEITKETNLS
jgi:hypothetical protein